MKSKIAKGKHPISAEEFQKLLNEAPQVDLRIQPVVPEKIKPYSDEDVIVAFGKYPVEEFKNVVELGETIDLRTQLVIPKSIKRVVTL